MQSISTLSKKAEMDALQLDFINHKKTGRFDNKKNLLDESFGIGTKAIINSIANQIKRGRFSENEVDAKATIDNVFSECKLVRSQ